MDYKTTVLSKPLEVESALLPEVQALKFGSISDEIGVFDYTAYFEYAQIEYVDYKVFMRLNATQIKTLASSANHSTSELFYQNTDGHILVASELTFLFLMFVDAQMLTYINGLLSEIFTDGVTYTAGYIMGLANSRLSDEAINLLTNERNQNTKGGN